MLRLYVACYCLILFSASNGVLGQRRAQELSSRHPLLFVSPTSSDRRVHFKLRNALQHRKSELTRPQAQSNTESISLSKAMSIKIASSLPLPLPYSAKCTLAEQVVEACLPQLESVLPAGKRKALRRASAKDVKDAIKEASGALADRIPDSVAILATREQRISIIEYVLTRALQDDYEALQGKAFAATQVGVLAARAAVRDKDRKTLVDTVCHSIELDKLIGQEAESAVVERLIGPLITQLEKLLPPDVQTFLQVSNPREYKQWKVQLTKSLLETLEGGVGQFFGVRQLLPTDKIKPLVESVVGTYLDVIVRQTDVLDESDAFTKEERIQDAFAREVATITEAEVAEERAKTLAALVKVRKRERVELERKLYWFPPWRWWRRWRRKAPVSILLL